MHSYSVANSNAFVIFAKTSKHTYYEENLFFFGFSCTYCKLHYTAQTRILREACSISRRCDSRTKNRHGFTPCSYPPTIGMATNGIYRLPALRDEHFHRKRMGQRQRQPCTFQSIRIELRTMGESVEGRRFQDGTSYRQAP